MSNSLSPQEHKLWHQWLHERDQDAANELVKTYFHLVNFHVQRISAHLPKNVNKDDVKSLGLMGLYDALKKFDLERDLKFDTYASFRIRGAIMDGLRKEDWLPRSVRDKAKRIEQASERLEQRYKRPPTSYEISSETGISAEDIEATVKDSLFANVLSMEEKPKDTNEEHKEGVGYSLADQTTLTPVQNVIQQENFKELAEQIKQLNEKEQMVISLFYHEELTLTEIGHVLELTTSRISQIHAKAIFKLKEALSEVVES
ncbi:FliA/WhiG family RNA polymerase sigma factor [Thalassobacillus sp. CUG 92003]|uniref:FliA/WhiG family RNA polymerase sigma factor n=1 Tax=Thalassobacillus sp. CUG 92003 TaxID=2736641 RepID=UPI0015E77D73|nr:FliA/WhiG family RNA polymerase sigma factor [Thalassobacillus sp. CUG 92003]